MSAQTAPMKVEASTVKSTNVADVSAVKVENDKVAPGTDDTVDEAPDKPQQGKKSTVAKVSKKKKWRKPKDKPKRPLSAYNIFFRHEREKLLYGNALGRRKPTKIGFAALAKNIAAKWKRLDAESRKIYEAQAEFEQIRYKAEVEEWKRNQSMGGSSSGQNHEDSLSKAFPGSNLLKPSAEDLFSQQQSRDALINHLMISQLMSNYTDPAARVPTPQQDVSGQIFTNPLLINAEIQSQLSYLTSGDSALDSLQAYSTPQTVSSPAAAAPRQQFASRRMSMPTSTTGQFAQQLQHQQQIEQGGLVGLPGSRRLSMPLGIIDNTQQTPVAERRSALPFEVPFAQQAAVDDIGVQSHSSIGTDMRMGIPGMENSQRRLSMPSGCVSGGQANAAGRRIPMAFSVEQQMFEKHLANLSQSNSQQHRGMSMPLGITDLPEERAGLDELADILKDDGDLFDW